MIHAFILHFFLTNTSHPTHPLLHKMIIFYYIVLIEGEEPPGPYFSFFFFSFYLLIFRRVFSEKALSHVPDVETMDGLTNLLSACIMVILGNVLDYRTYLSPNSSAVNAADRVGSALHQNDVNAIPYDERVAICYARGVALRLLDWIRCCTVIKDRDGNLVEDLCSFFFVQIAHSLPQYKQDATSAKLELNSKVKLELLREQVFNVVGVAPSFWNFWDRRNQIPIPVDSLSLANWDGYTVQWIPQAEFKEPPDDKSEC